ncbi:MAG: hypothetical protein IJ405_02295 [Lachnospiraceae bacterium]|nr:hypothetical protein [Lachnospiraceae bacterium]
MIGFLIVIAAIAAFYIYIYRHWDYKKKFNFKSVMIYISLGLLVLMIELVISFVMEAAEEERYNMLESRLDRVQYLEAYADYSQMQDILVLYDDYEPEFEYAWERVEMYANYNQYLIFRNAAENGLGEEYVAMAEKYREALLALCLEPDYPENIPYGEDFLKRAGLFEEN